jgi:hypothetical protein
LKTDSLSEDGLSQLTSLPNESFEKPQPSNPFEDLRLFHAERMRSG